MFMVNYPNGEFPGKMLEKHFLIAIPGIWTVKLFLKSEQTSIGGSSFWEKT